MSIVSTWALHETLSFLHSFLDRVTPFLRDAQGVIDFQNYVIPKERRHADQGVHFRLLLIARKKFDIRTPNLLDLEYKEKVYHGRYEYEIESISASPRLSPFNSKIRLDLWFNLGKVIRYGVGHPTKSFVMKVPFFSSTNGKGPSRSHSYG